MITAEEALRLAKAKPQVTVEERALDDSELIAYGFIDYTIEAGIHDKFNGEPFEFDIPVGVALTPQVIQAIKRRYEEGRWTVAVFPRLGDDDSVVSFHMVFCPKEVVEAPKRAVPLPVVLGNAQPTVHQTRQARVLVRMPTRGRPQKALEALGAYVSLAGMPIKLEVVVDTDDETVTSQFLYRLNQLGATVTFGEHKTKIEACNGGRVNEWDIIVLGSDDMVPVEDGWAKRVVELYEEHFPHFDGCLHLDDGYAHERVCTLSILGRRYYELVGKKIYHPDYKSLFCDDHHTETAKALGRIVYVPEMLVEHKHPVANKASLDELYRRNDRLWKEDKETWERHKAEGLVQRPKLSILILTYGQRYEMLERLLDFLYWQRARSWHLVDIVVDHKPAASLGAKRQRMLENARGEYVCFVDDDDWVSHDFIDRVCGALEKDPDADCTSLVGILTTNGDRPEKFDHSLKYDRWATLENGLHIRTPNHLNAIKREIALKAGFENLTFGEDHTYSRAVKPLLQKEAETGEVPLYHYWFRTKKFPEGEVR